ncbi:MAG: hypothetical protein K6D37_01675 [Prevotella sp.]|nr:hypothetical protein [Prevotella sp.]
MKRNNLFRFLMLALFAFMSLQMSAQGIYVNKKNGEIIAYPKAIFDKVTPMTQGSKRGVDVWKTDGTKDTYMESELLSITTFEVEFDERITQDIPEEYLTKMSAYMPIYSGSTPPAIEGVYIITPSTRIYDSGTNSIENVEYADVIPEYTDQNMTKNTVMYRYQQRSGSSVITTSEKEEAKVLGEGENFTTFTIVTTSSTTDDSWSKMATICSGTKVSDGIKNFYRGILLLDKYDPNNNIMAVGDFRIFKDGDGMSEYDQWLARQKNRGTISTDLPLETEAVK